MGHWVSKNYFYVIYTPRIRRERLAIIYPFCNIFSSSRTQKNSRARCGKALCTRRRSNRGMANSSARYEISDKQSIEKIFFAFVPNTQFRFLLSEWCCAARTLYSLRIHCRFGAVWLLFETLWDSQHIISGIFSFLIYRFAALAPRQHSHSIAFIFFYDDT